jgi:hypothetical protein
MQIFLQLNNPLSPILTGATFNITANVGIVIPATATGSQLLSGFPAIVNSAAGIITLTPVGTQCNDPIDIWITQPTTTTSTTTADPRICFTYSAPLPNLYSVTVLPTLPGYAGKPTYAIPGIGFVYWSPSQSRWEFGSLVDTGNLYSYLNSTGATPISGSPNNWIDSNIATGDPSMTSSLLGPCPDPTTTTTSTSSTSTTSSTSSSTTTSSSSTTTSSSSSTTTTTAAPTCCAPVATGISQNAGTGIITVTYTYSSNPLTCLTCSGIKLEYSTNGGSSWIFANATGCGTQITTTSKPNGTLFRLLMTCTGSPDSTPSNIVTLVSATTTSTTTVAAQNCIYGVTGGTVCCNSVISSIGCVATTPGTGLGGGNYALVVNSSSNTPSNCQCGTHYFVEYRINGSGSWLGGSPIGSDYQGRIIINSLYGSLNFGSTNYIDIRIRTTCSGSTWSNEFTYYPCITYYNPTSSPITLPISGGIIVPAFQTYCYSGQNNFTSVGMQRINWCWQSFNAGGTLNGTCSQC